MDLTTDELLFGYSGDLGSEREVIDDLSGLNYLVDNLVFNIRSQNLLSSSVPPAYTTAGPDSARDLFMFIKEEQLSAGDAWNIVVDYILRNALYSAIHTNFFDGQFFFGVGTESYRLYLDRLMNELVESGKFGPSPFPRPLLKVNLSGRFDDVAVQRWRSMTAEAVFRTNDNVETSLNVELLASVGTIEKTFEAIFCQTGIRIIGQAEHLQLVAIVMAARALSHKIQKGFLSCRLVVTRAREPLGTYALGLDKIRGTERTVMVEPKIITEDMVSSYFN